MAVRGYTLIDFTVPNRPGVDADAVVRFMEHVRQHFHEIVPGVPSESEVDLLASGTAHNVGLRPLLALYAPPSILPTVPDWWLMTDLVQKWAGSLSDEQFWEIVRITDAPTWAALQAVGVHPQRGR